MPYRLGSGRNADRVPARRNRCTATPDLAADGAVTMRECRDSGRPRRLVRRLRPRRAAPLFRTAWLLTGDWYLAEDLVQETLARHLPQSGRSTL